MSTDLTRQTIGKELFSLFNEKDSSGVYGGIFHYSLIIALVAGAFFAFLYFWSKGRLDLDEEPKWQMLNQDEKRINDED